MAAAVSACPMESAGSRLFLLLAFLFIVAVVGGSSPASACRVRQLRAPVQGRVPRLLPRPGQRRFLRVRRPGHDPGRRRAPGRREPRAVQGRRRLRRVLPGPVHGRRPLQRVRRQGRRHGPGARHGPRRPRAHGRGVRGHGPRRRRHARRAGAQGAARRECGVQARAVRAPRAPQSLGARGGGHAGSRAAAGDQVPVPGRADGHRGRGRGGCRVIVGVEAHGAGARRAGVEDDGPGRAGGPAKDEDGGDRRV